MKRLSISLFLLGILLVFGCQEKSSSTSPAADSTATADTTKVEAPAKTATAPAGPDSVMLLATAKEAMKAAADGNFEQFAQYIHPVAGIRFSPYAYVEKETDKVFTADAFREQVTKNPKQKLVWGTYDPVGETIKLTVAGYFKEFVTDKNYLGEGKFAYNETLGGGTVINNLSEIYPDAPRVEANWTPKDEEKAPFEWGTVRMVFQEHEGKYYLIAVVHDAWNT